MVCAILVVNRTVGLYPIGPGNIDRNPRSARLGIQKPGDEVTISHRTRELPWQVHNFRICLASGHPMGFAGGPLGLCSFGGCSMLSSSERHPRRYILGGALLGASLGQRSATKC